MSQDGASVSSSQIGNVDLCEWENKLNDFLSYHEAATLSFNLEEFGKDLVVNCKHLRQRCSGRVEGNAEKYGR